MVRTAAALPISPQKAPTIDAHAQPTEVVYITSSVYKGGGPVPRALKRRDKKYMLPRSPESPTRHEKQLPGSRSTLAPSSVHRRKKDCFISVDVSQLVVDSIQLVTAGAESKSNNSSWSPILSEEQTKSMDVRRAPEFDPSQKHVSGFSLLRSLDLHPATGLNPTDFWTLFSRCQACNHYMTTRTIPYHQCPGEIYESDASPSFQRIDCRYLRDLDAHISGNEAGVSEEAFLAAFYTCRQCGRYTTRRMSSAHTDSEFDKDYSGKCIFLALQGNNSTQGSTNV